MAAKAKVAAASKKAKVSKATGKARGRPKGLQLSSAQAKAYNKAFNATAQKLQQAATIRAFAKGLRKYRLAAANSTIRKYNIARANAQAAAVAAHAASMSLKQSVTAHQNLALQRRIGEDAFRHTTLLGRAQFAQAGEKAYMHAAIMRTLTQKQAVSAETKFLSKVVKTAKKAGTAKRPKAKGTPLSKSIGAAASAAGKAAAAKIPRTTTTGKVKAAATKATAKAGTTKTKVVAANAKASAKAAATSAKAPAKAAKTRTCPRVVGEAIVSVSADPEAYARAMAGWTGVGVVSQPPKVVTTSRREWVGDEITPNCIVTAIANSMLRTKSVVASDKDLKELTELAGPEPTIEEVLWQVYLTGWPGRSTHLAHYREVPDDCLEAEGLVIGFAALTDDGWADHCALSLGDGKVVSWGEERDLESLIEEAWELTWLV